MKRQPDQPPGSRHKPLSPVEQLLADKMSIEAQCREQEKKLGEDFAYLREHAPSLLFSGISSLLFSSENSGRKAGGQTVATAGEGRQNTALRTPFAASDYLAITKSLLSVVWNISRPMLITWGINKAKFFIAGLFSGKKKNSLRN
jgi:hypothetical protein